MKVIQRVEKIGERADYCSISTLVLKKEDINWFQTY